jgi:transcriptional regulator with XRE-family HTH domain
MEKAPSAVDAHVGRRIRDRRNALGLSQGKLGDGVGLTFQQIQKYEKGTNRVSASRLQQFANMLKVDAAWFFEGGPGSKRGRATDQSTETLREFTELPDAHKLMKAFVRIEDKELRRRIAQLGERLADVG